MALVEFWGEMNQPNKYNPLCTKGQLDGKNCLYISKVMLIHR